MTLKNEDDIKNEDDLKNNDILKNGDIIKRRVFPTTLPEDLLITPQLDRYSKTNPKPEILSAV